MEGAAERERRAVEGIVVQAWWNENLNGCGSKLKPLKHYLDLLKPKKRQGPQGSGDILAVFQEHQRRGAPIRIRHIGPDGNELN